MIETNRLLLRPMSEGDLDDLLGIFGDPAVMAAFDGRPLTAEQVSGWLERNLAHQREHGFGLFAVCRKADARLIGDCGLENVNELGYDFRSDCWNRGYATEAAAAVRDFAFTTLRLPRLVSFIRTGNAASARVAEKIGMQKTGELQRYGRTYGRYEITGYGSESSGLCVSCADGSSFSGPT